MPISALAKITPPNNMHGNCMRLAKIFVQQNILAILIIIMFYVAIMHLFHSNKILDSENDGVSKHLGQIADIMYEWEGTVAENLGLTKADIAAIKTKYPINLKLQA